MVSIKASGSLKRIYPAIYMKILTTHIVFIFNFLMLSCYGLVHNPTSSQESIVANAPIQDESEQETVTLINALTQLRPPIENSVTLAELFDTLDKIEEDLSERVNSLDRSDTNEIIKILKAKAKK